MGDFSSNVITMSYHKEGQHGQGSGWSTVTAVPIPESVPDGNQMNYMLRTTCTFSGSASSDGPVTYAIDVSRFEAGMELAVCTDEGAASLTLTARVGNSVGTDGFITKTNNATTWYKDLDIGDGTILSNGGLISLFGGPNVGSGLGRLSGYIELHASIDAQNSVTSKHIYTHFTGMYGYRPL